MSVGVTFQHENFAILNLDRVHSNDVYVQPFFRNHANFLHTTPGLGFVVHVQLMRVDPKKNLSA